MRRIFIFLSLAVLFFTSCESPKYDVVIDNPMLDDLTIQVGEESHVVLGFTSLTLPLTEGENTIVAKNDSGLVVFDETLTIVEEGIVNLTGFTYVVWRDMYLKDPMTYNDFIDEALTIDSLVTVNEKEYNDVDFAVYEGDVFIVKTWDFGLDEMWSDSIDIYDYDDYSVYAKIYRVDDLEEDWGYYGDWDYSSYTDEEFDVLIDSLAGVIAVDSIL